VFVMASGGRDDEQAPALSVVSPIIEEEEEEHSSEISSPASPSDTRHPLSRYESITQESEDSLATSFQSTDTVRRRPEELQSGYGMLDRSFSLFRCICHGLSWRPILLVADLRGYRHNSYTAAYYFEISTNRSITSRRKAYSPTRGLNTIYSFVTLSTPWSRADQECSKTKKAPHDASIFFKHTRSAPRTGVLR
jgi:hypothetical protein